MTATLYGSKQTGSLIVELALELSNRPYKTVDIDYKKIASGKSAELKKINPLVRVPTLVVSKNETLTESGAMIFWIAAQSPSARLIPPPRSVDYAKFLHLLFLITGEIYPCFTFGDDPSEWVRSPSEQLLYGKNVLQHHQELWRYAESLVSKSGPWSLGSRFTAVDLFLGVMTLWRPRQEWFLKNTPRIARIGERARQHRKLRAVFERHGITDSVPQ